MWLSLAFAALALPSVAAAQQSARATVLVQATVIASVAPLPIPAAARTTIAAAAVRATAPTTLPSTTHEDGEILSLVVIPAAAPGAKPTLVVTTVVP